MALRVGMDEYEGTHRERLGLSTTSYSHSPFESFVATLNLIDFEKRIFQ
jgi:hypothetical protein